MGPARWNYGARKSPAIGGAPRNAIAAMAAPTFGSLDVEEAPQRLRGARMAQLAQGLGFYLADALAGDVELLADFLEGVVGVHVDAEAHAQDLRFPRGQPGQHVAHRL